MKKVNERHGNKSRTVSRIRITFCSTLVCFFLLCGAGLAVAQSDLPRGPYLGQDPPGLEPVVFSPGFVSTADVSEFSCTFSRDGKEFYFSRQTGDKQFSIFVTRETSNGWAPPELASFSVEFFNHEPYIAHNGNRIYWGSVRPLPDGSTGYSIWFADRENGGWGEPQPLGFDAMYITSSQNGNLYYTGKGKGGAVLARATPDDSTLDHEVLAEPLLSEYWDGHPCIAADESFLIFDSENRPESDECGLFISFRKADGSWAEPTNMKTAISNGRYAMFSPDGKYLFFSAPGKGTGKDIYWVDSRMIEMFRPPL